MSSTNAPFGLVAVRHPSGSIRARAYTIASGYATALYKGSPVKLVTAGGINLAAATEDMLGQFVGVEYTDSEGRRVTRNNWVASTAGTDIVAWVIDDPETEYVIQANGSIAATAVGDQADFVNAGSGSATTGYSSAALTTSLEGAGNQGQLTILGLDPEIDNAWGDSYTRVRVRIAQHQFRSNKVAI